MTPTEFFIDIEITKSMVFRYLGKAPARSYYRGWVAELNADEITLAKYLKLKRKLYQFWKAELERMV